MNQKLTVTLLALSLSACAGSSGRTGDSGTPRERYVASVNQHLSGDAEGSYDTLIGLAHDAPDTRAGNRARATLQSGDATTVVATIGILSAIAVPNFIRYQARSKQAEVKLRLSAIAVAMMASKAERNRFCTTFEECDVDVSGGRYLYFLSPDVAAGGERASDPARLRALARDVLPQIGIAAGFGKSGFLVVGVGDPDDDGELDVWTVDENAEVIHVLDDLDSK